MSPEAEGTQTADVALEDIPFEELFRSLRAGEPLGRFDAAFGRIVAEVAARVRARFADDVAGSAVQSAVGTFLRRAEGDGGNDALKSIDGPDALIGHLVLIAHGKAWEKLKWSWRHRPLPDGVAPIIVQPPDGGTDPREEESRFNAAIRAETARLLDEQLRRMRELLSQKQRRDVFELLLPKLCGLDGPTQAEIAARAGVSERTVRRIQCEVEPFWSSLAEDSRMALRSFDAGLRQGLPE